MDPCIEVEHLHKHYGPVEAVRGVSFNVARGEIFGLLGQNGAGKTTIVECLQGLRRADAGKLRVLGLNPATHAQALRRRIGCQLQDSALPDRIKVWEALSLFASLTSSKTNWRKLMEDWGLSQKANSHFSTLSGGQRQRLFVALALVNSPEVVFLDEMTTGLDPAARHVAWELIRQIRERGATVVLVTHFMDEAQKLCDRLAIVDKGLIVALDSPRGLIKRYAADLRVTFTSEESDLSWLETVACVDKVERAGQHVTVYGKDPVLLFVAAKLIDHGITPHDLRLHQPGLEDVFLKLTAKSGGLD